MKKDNNKTFSSIIKDLLKTPRGRGILFFVAYFLFFLAVILLVRFGNRGSVIGSDLDYGKKYNFSLSNITDENYDFSYEVTIDNITTAYQGSRYDDVELFKVNDGVNISEYYRDLDNYFINNGQLWLKSENPYRYYQFIDINNISNIIDSATYISNTSYESGKSVYNFQISTATITKLFENLDIDIDEVPNELMVITDEDGYVNEFQFKLDSYCSFKQICSDGMRIVLKYDNYGKVKEITSPLD